MARKPTPHARRDDDARQFQDAIARVRDINDKAKAGTQTSEDIQEAVALTKKMARLRQDMQNPSYKKLFNAAGNGRFALVRKYIERDGMDVDTRNDGGSTPLCHAASDGNIKIVQYLIEQGANVNVRDAHGLSPLASAAAKNDVAMFRLLLENGANMRGRTTNGLSVRKLAEYNSSHGVLAIMNDKVYMAQFAKKPAAKKGTPAPKS